LQTKYENVESTANVRNNVNVSSNTFYMLNGVY